ncbi:MAG: DUF952 domain-containing protein [Pseudomonadota bacterium]
MQLIFKIEDASIWRAAEADGVYTGAPIDHADGFIHFSTGEQLAETLGKHFAGRRGLCIIALDADDLGDRLAWEPSRGGALFPHLYGPLDTRLAVGVRDLPDNHDLSDFADWGIRLGSAIL